MEHKLPEYDEANKILKLNILTVKNSTVNINEIGNVNLDEVIQEIVNETRTDPDGLNQGRTPQVF